MALLLALVFIGWRTLRAERRAREALAASQAALLAEIEAQTRSTRHALKGLTRALDLEAKVRELRVPAELDGEPPPE